MHGRRWINSLELLNLKDLIIREFDLTNAFIQHVFGFGERKAKGFVLLIRLKRGRSTLIKKT